MVEVDRRLETLRPTASWRVPFLVVVPYLLALSPALYLIARWFNQTLDLELYVNEWGVLESLHSLFCALSLGLFYLSWRWGEGAVKVAGGALAMLSAAAFVREVDIKNAAQFLDIHWLNVIASSGLQEILLVGMTLPIFIYLYRERRHFWGIVELALRWQAWPLYAAGAIVLGTVYLDESVVVGIEMRFWEELIETYGYVFMSLAAWRHLQLVGDESWDRQT